MSKCEATTITRGALFRPDQAFWRCDRERGHTDQHHATQPSGAEMFWGAVSQHKTGDLHDYDLRCKTCGQPGVIRVSVDPAVEESEYDKVMREFG